MSSNIKVQRICQHCTKEFTARKTITMYCSHRCNSAAYKAKQRTIKVEASNKEKKDEEIFVSYGPKYWLIRDFWKNAIGE